MARRNYKVLILGGGTGGISIAAKLKGRFAKGQIALIEPSESHYYQPMWTLAGMGLVNKSTTERSEKKLIPSGITWVKSAVTSIDPDLQQVQTNDGEVIGYEYLVVATGLKLNWDQIDGLKGNLGRNGICTVYEYQHIDYTASLFQNFKGGRAVFVMPPVPIKCAGAPQKVMYIADNIFRNHGVRDKSEIVFATAGKAMFGIPVFADALAKIVTARDIHPRFNHKLIAVNADKREAAFAVTGADGVVTRDTIQFDILHVVPTMSPHSFIAESPLACAEGDQKGWLAVDKFTLQHLKYKNVFGVGDVTGIPNSKTGAAIRKQYPIVAKNLLSVMSGQKPTEHYDGYSSCPLITEIGKVMLAEFGYDGKLLPTFPLNPAVPHRAYWHLKKKVLPKLYWYGMMKGLA